MERDPCDDAHPTAVNPRTLADACVLLWYGLYSGRRYFGVYLATASVSIAVFGRQVAFAPIAVTIGLALAAIALTAALCVLLTFAFANAFPRSYEFTNGAIRVEAGRASSWGGIRHESIAWCDVRSYHVAGRLVMIDRVPFAFGDVRARAAAVAMLRARNVENV